MALWCGRKKPGNQVGPLVLPALPCSKQCSVVAGQQHSGHLATARQPSTLLGPHLLPQPCPPHLLPPPPHPGFFPTFQCTSPASFSVSPRPERAEGGGPCTLALHLQPKGSTQHFCPFSPPFLKAFWKLQPLAGAGAGTAYGVLAFEF